MTRDRLLTELDISSARKWTRLNDSADRGIEAVASAVRSTDGHMIAIALCYLQYDVSAKESERLLNLLLASCQKVGTKFADKFWLRAH
jgi:DNA-binding IclR family transcriptional regulator